MNAPIYPKSLVGTTVYSVETEEGEYNDETEEYGPEVVTVSAGEIIGVSLNSEGDFFFLVLENDGSLGSWQANGCTTIEPEATT